MLVKAGRALRRFCRRRGIRGYGPDVLQYLQDEIEAASQDGRSFSASCEEIAAELVIGVSTVRRWLKVFELKGLLRRGRNWCRAFVHGVMTICRLADSYVLTFELGSEEDEEPLHEDSHQRSSLAVRRIVSRWTTGELHKLAKKALNALQSAEALTLSGVSSSNPYPDLFSPSVTMKKAVWGSYDKVDTGPNSLYANLMRKGVSRNV